MRICPATRALLALLALPLIFGGWHRTDAARLVAGFLNDHRPRPARVARPRLATASQPVAICDLAPRPARPRGVPLWV